MPPLPRPLRWACAVGALAALLAGTAAAQPAPATGPAPQVAAPTAPAAAPAATAADSGFKPLAPGESAAPPDTMSAPGLVKVAYSLIWLAVVVFLLGLWRRNRRLGDEVAALRARLDRLPKGN